MRTLAFLFVAGAVCGTAVAAEAQDFYPKQTTVGCFTIGITRRMTDPRDARRSDPVWMKAAMKDGNCRQVPHEEDWKLVTQVDDFSLMRHDVPGSDPAFLFFRSSELADWHGQSPGNKPAPLAATNVGNGVPRENADTAAKPGSAVGAMPRPQGLPNSR